MATYATTDTDSLAVCCSKETVLGQKFETQPHQKYMGSGFKLLTWYWNEANPSDVEDELSDLPDGYGTDMYKKRVNFAKLMKQQATKLPAGETQNQSVEEHDVPNRAIE